MFLGLPEVQPGPHFGCHHYEGVPGILTIALSLSLSHSRAWQGIVVPFEWLWWLRRHWLWTLCDAACLVERWRHREKSSPRSHSPASSSLRQAALRTWVSVFLDSSEAPWEGHFALPVSERIIWQGPSKKAFFLLDFFPLTCPIIWDEKWAQLHHIGCYFAVLIISNTC